MKYLTRDFCQNIVKTNEAFTCSETIVQGFRIEMYGYNLCNYSDFNDLNAWELRGLTFVYNPFTKIWERWLALHKFFNIGQCPGYLIEDVEHKKIIKVQDKADGSMITFVKLPNGNFVAKSKMSFVSDQAVMAQEIYEKDENIKRIVQDQVGHEQNLIFELCSFKNQIVIQYDCHELRLLQVRNSHGDYHDVEAFKSYNVPITESYNKSYFNLDNLLVRKEVDTTNIEGWVVQFEDGQMAKIKTDHYLQLHSIIGPDAFRANILIKTIIDDNIDDVISQLNPGNKRDIVEEITENVQHFHNHLCSELAKILTMDSEMERKDFAIKYNKHKYFGVLMGVYLKKFELLDGIKEFIIKNTTKLNAAEKFLEKLKDNK